MVNSIAATEVAKSQAEQWHHSLFF